MHIVIDIPSEMYDWLDNGFPDEDDAEKLWQIVKNGTQLPKGHERLIYAKDVGEYLTLADVPTIIKADTDRKSEDVLEQRMNSSENPIRLSPVLTNEQRRKVEEMLRNRDKNCSMTANNRMYEIATGALEEPKRLTNAEWKDFLSKQFGISKASAKEMLHVMMSVKRKDDFKKQFSGRK